MWHSKSISCVECTPFWITFLFKFNCELLLSWHSPQSMNERSNQIRFQHLVAAFIMCESIAHGLLLRWIPSPFFSERWFHCHHLSTINSLVFLRNDHSSSFQKSACPTVPVLHLSGRHINRRKKIPSLSASHLLVRLALPWVLSPTTLFSSTTTDLLFRTTLPGDTVLTLEGKLVDFQGPQCVTVYWRSPPVPLHQGAKP